MIVRVVVENITILDIPIFVIPAGPIFFIESWYAVGFRTVLFSWEAVLYEPPDAFLRVSLEMGPFLCRFEHLI